MRRKIKEFWQQVRSAFGRNVLYYNPVLTWALGISTVVAAATTLRNGWIIAQVFAIVMIPVSLISCLLYRRMPRAIRAAAVPVTAAVFYTAAIVLLRQQYGEWTTLFRYFLPLMAVNSLILSRGVRYAPQQSFALALVDSVTCSVGFGLAACIVGGIRELISSGVLYVLHTHMAAVPFFGFIVLGFLAAAVRAIRLNHDRKQEAKRKFEEKRKGGGAA